MPRLVLTVAMFAFALLPVCAQPQPPNKDAKQDTGKTPAKEIKSPETKTPAKDMKSTDPAVMQPARPTLDKLKLPANAIIVLIEKLQEANELIPEAVILSLQQYRELKDRVRALEQQLKGAKATPHSCKLTGKLEGDYVALRAEFTFATQQPKTAVFLGLQGAHLVEGELDKHLPQLDYGDDGFVVRVDKEGNHQLTLNLKVPVGLKRGAGPAAERTFDLGLPGAPVTTLSLELPAAIKEVHVGDSIKKSKTGGRWDALPLGMTKQVVVAWKEPQAEAGGAPLLTLDAQIVVKLEEPFPQLQAELLLEVLRGQTKTWRLLLPPGATATLKAPLLPAGDYEWVVPDAKNPWHVLQLKEATTERIVVSVQADVLRPTAKLAAGPFALAEAFRQQGTVLVQATPGGLRGQRLIYHRSGDVMQRDLPSKSPAEFENLAYFQYALVQPSAPAATKPPVEIEFKSGAGLAEAQTDHTLRLRGEGALWFVETTTRIQAKSLVEATDYIDVQLPRRRAPGIDGFAVAPALTFPAALPWQMLASADGRLTWAAPSDARWEEEGTELTAPDGVRLVRLRWSRQNAKQATLTIHGKYAVPPGSRFVRLELPRALGVLDRGGVLSVNSGPLVELLTGPPGAQEPAPERHRWQRLLEIAPITADVAWRPHQPTLAVSAVVNVTVHEHSAQVRQHLSFTLPTDKGGAVGNVRLRVPQSIKQSAVEAGGKLLGEPNPENGLVWVAPVPDAAGKCELLLEYDVPVPASDNGAQPAAPVAWNVPLIWPEAATRRDAKVRVWCAPGTFLALAGARRGSPDPAGGDWHERGIESVPGHDSLPALVVHGTGAHVPLTAPVRPASQAALAALVCDRVLIQVRVDDDGNQFYRARYLVRKLAARKLTLELPVPVRGSEGSNLQSVRFGPDKQEKALAWDDPARNLAVVNFPGEVPNLQAQPVIVEVEYKVPAALGDSRRFTQTLLHPPHWHGEVLAGSVRWHVDLPADQVALVLGAGATLDYRWTLQGWLVTPQTNVTNADLEAWLMGHEGGEATLVDLAFWRPGLGTQRLVHFPRQWWLLVCSGLVLALGLALYLLPLAWPVRWLVLAALAVGVVAGALFWPAAAPWVVYGCEPGLAVLLILLGMQWLWRERYRRQVVIMPGFARLPGGSTLTRAKQAAKPREPSTVDSPVMPQLGAGFLTPPTDPTAGLKSSVK